MRSPKTVNDLVCISRPVATSRGWPTSSGTRSTSTRRWSKSPSANFSRRIRAADASSRSCVTAPPRTRSTTNSGQYSPPNWSTPASRARRILCSGGQFLEAPGTRWHVLSEEIHVVDDSPVGGDNPVEAEPFAQDPGNHVTVEAEPDPATALPGRHTVGKQDLTRTSGNGGDEWR